MEENINDTPYPHFITDPEPAQDSPARDHEARVMAWKQAQRELHTAYPEDVDAAAFYALANVSYATTQFSPDQEPDYTRQRQAGALLEDAPHASAHYVHALDYIMYGHLQLGNEAEARQTLDRVNELDEIYPASFAAYNTAALQARYYLERQDWEAAAQLELRTPDALAWEDFPAGEALFYYARGLGAARSGDLAQAEVEGEQLQALANTLQGAGETTGPTRPKPSARRWRPGPCTNGVRPTRPWL